MSNIHTFRQGRSSLSAGERYFLRVEDCLMSTAIFRTRDGQEIAVDVLPGSDSLSYNGSSIVADYTPSIQIYQYPEAKKDRMMIMRDLRCHGMCTTTHHIEHIPKASTSNCTRCMRRLLRT